MPLVLAKLWEAFENDFKGFPNVEEKCSGGQKHGHYHPLKAELYEGEQGTLSNEKLGTVGDCMLKTADSVIRVFQGCLQRWVIFASYS